MWHGAVCARSVFVFANSFCLCVCVYDLKCAKNCNHLNKFLHPYTLTHSFVGAGSYSAVAYCCKWWEMKRYEMIWLEQWLCVYWCLVWFSWRSMETIITCKYAPSLPLSRQIIELQCCCCTSTRFLSISLLLFHDSTIEMKMNWSRRRSTIYDRRVHSQCR